MSRDANTARAVLIELTSSYNATLYELSSRWSDPYHLKNDRTKSYPNADAKGVYALIASDGAVAYIGKASDGEGTIGKRIASHERAYEENDHPAPTHAITCALPDATSEEIVALEDWLIKKFKPTDNDRGK